MESLQNINYNVADPRNQSFRGEIAQPNSFREEGMYDPYYEAGEEYGEEERLSQQSEDSDFFENLPDISD